MSNVNYDLIIVGAGTAGCVLAERLTHSGKLKDSWTEMAITLPNTPAMADLQLDQH